MRSFLRISFMVSCLSLVSISWFFKVQTFTDHLVFFTANSWCLYKSYPQINIRLLGFIKTVVTKYFEFKEITKNTCAKWNSVPIWKVRSVWPGAVENRIFCLRAEISISIIYHDTFILGRLAKNMDMWNPQKVFPKLFNQKELLKDCKCSKVIKLCLCFVIWNRTKQ